MRGRVVMVYKLNQKDCEHGVSRGFSCEDCAEERGRKLMNKLSETTRRLAEAERQLRGVQS